MTNVTKINCSIIDNGIYADMVTEISNLCLMCKNSNNANIFSCRAFIEIPEEISIGDFDHTKPHPDDNGIQFEPIEEE